MNADQNYESSLILNTTDLKQQTVSLLQTKPRFELVRSNLAFNKMQINVKKTGSDKFGTFSSFGP